MPQFCITQGGASKFAHNKSAYWPILSDDMILCLEGTYDIILCRVPTPRGMRLTNKRKARGNRINIPLCVISFKFFFLLCFARIESRFSLMILFSHFV